MHVYHTGAGSGNSCVLLTRTRARYDPFAQDSTARWSQPSTDDLSCATGETSDLRSELATVTGNSLNDEDARGVVVAIVTNLSDVRLVQLAKDLADVFE